MRGKVSVTAQLAIQLKAAATDIAAARTRSGNISPTMTHRITPQETATKNTNACAATNDGGRSEPLVQRAANARCAARGERVAYLRDGRSVVGVSAVDAAKHAGGLLDTPGGYQVAGRCGDRAGEHQMGDGGHDGRHEHPL